MTRRALTPARKKRIADLRNWQTPSGEPLALENGRVVLLGTGEAPEFDHAYQHALSDDDSDENMRPMSVEAHKEKSKADAKVRGKIRRLTGQNKRKPKRKIRSRGFDTRYRKKVSGKLEIRDGPPHQR